MIIGGLEVSLVGKTEEKSLEVVGRSKDGIDFIFRFRSIRIRRKYSFYLRGIWKEYCKVRVYF